MARIKSSFNGGSVKKSRAKLSASNSAAMTPSEQALARWIIRGSYVNERTGEHFSPLFTFKDGELTGTCMVGGALRSDGLSYGETICYAIRTSRITLAGVQGTITGEVSNPNWPKHWANVESVREVEGDSYYIPHLHHIKGSYIEEYMNLYPPSDYAITRREYWELYKNISSEPTGDMPTPDVDVNDWTNPEPVTVEPDPEPVVITPLDDKTEWFKWLKDVRYYLDNDSGTKENPDGTSMTTYKNGAAMLAVGIPLCAVKDAYAKTWPEHMRSHMGVIEYDARTFGEPEDGEHKVTPYVDALIKANVMPFLVGHTQAGKGYIASSIAKRRDIPFGVVPCSAGISPAWIMGRNTPQGFQKTDFIEIFPSQGVFLFDEIDAADSNILLMVNDALSNNVLRNPINGETYIKGLGFIGMAAANTYGTGATVRYGGRERLDDATLERFRMGRTWVEYDYDLAESVASDVYASVKDGE